MSFDVHALRQHIVTTPFKVLVGLDGFPIPFHPKEVEPPIRPFWPDQILHCAFLANQSTRIDSAKYQSFECDSIDSLFHWLTETAEGERCTDVLFEGLYVCGERMQIRIWNRYTWQMIMRSMVKDSKTGLFHPRKNK